MKKHITLAQLNELSEGAKERLRKWWKPQEGDFIYVYKSNSPYEEKGIYCLFEDKDTNCGLFINYTNETFYPGATNINELEIYYPLLSIGQLLELIDEESSIIEVFNAVDKEKWCDAIWNLAKHKLEL